jgi:fructose-bisphosphate aldolase class I
VRQVVPGIRSTLARSRSRTPGDEVTQGLDGLAKRLDAWEQGARFAVARVYNISDAAGRLAIEANADALARAAIPGRERRAIVIGVDGRRSYHRALRRSDPAVLTKSGP